MIVQRKKFCQLFHGNVLTEAVLAREVTLKRKRRQRKRRKEGRKEGKEGRGEKEGRDKGKRRKG